MRQSLKTRLLSLANPHDAESFFALCIDKCSNFNSVDIIQIINLSKDIFLNSHADVDAPKRDIEALESKLFDFSKYIDFELKKTDYLKNVLSMLNYFLNIDVKTKVEITHLHNLFEILYSCSLITLPDEDFVSA